METQSSEWTSSCFLRFCWNSCSWENSMQLGNKSVGSYASNTCFVLWTPASQTLTSLFVWHIEIIINCVLLFILVKLITTFYFFRVSIDYLLNLTRLQFSG